MKAKVRITLRFLMDTWIEKGCVLGEEAKNDQDKIAEMIRDIVAFWSLEDEVADLLQQFEQFQNETSK